jgi:hypothetical protein
MNYIVAVDLMAVWDGNVVYDAYLVIIFQAFLSHMCGMYL